MHFHMFYNMGLACSVQCPRKGSINKPFSYVKHCCDSDIVEEQCCSDKDSEEGQANG
jgi:hypothetical protein